MSSEAPEKDNRSTSIPPQTQYDKTGYADDSDGLVRGEAKAEANVVVLGGLDARSPDGAVPRSLEARYVQMVSCSMDICIQTKCLDARLLLAALSELVSL